MSATAQAGGRVPDCADRHRRTVGARIDRPLAHHSALPPIPVIKGMTLSVQPVIAVMMLILTWQIGADGIKAIGWVQAIVIAGISLLALTKFKLHPAFLIIAAFLYGGLVIPHL